MIPRRSRRLPTIPRVGIPADCRFSPILALASVIEPLFIANWLARAPALSLADAVAGGRGVRASSGLRLCRRRCRSARPCDATMPSSCWRASSRRSTPRDRESSAPGCAGWRATAPSSAASRPAARSWPRPGLLDGAEVAVHWDNLPGLPRSSIRVPRGRASSSPSARAADLRRGERGPRHDAALDRCASGPGAGQGDRRPPAAASAAPRRPRASSAAGCRVLARAACPCWRGPGPDGADISRSRSPARLSPRASAIARQLQRLFARALGSRRSRQYRWSRLAKAHALLQQTRSAGDGSSAQRRLRLAGAFLAPLPPHFRPLPAPTATSRPTPRCSGGGGSEFPKQTILPH